MRDRAAWRKVRLGDLISVKHGWPFRGELCNVELTGNPIVVNIGNFQYGGGFRFETTTTREYRGPYPTEYELRPGDLLLIMTCQTAGGEILGIPARVPDDGRVYLHNQRLGKVVLRNATTVDPGYLYPLFRSSAFNRELFLSATGTKILHTAPSRIEAFTFSLPPLSEQRAISGLLGAIDEKIDLNRRTNETLETIARAIFKSWFVDFDPVRAKAERRQPARMGSVGSVIEIKRGAITPGTFADELFDHYSIPAFDEGRMPKQEPGESIKSNKFVVSPQAVLLSKLNPRFPRVWLPVINASRRPVCSTEFIVSEPKPGFSREFVYCLFSSATFAESFSELVTGTSSSHQRVMPEDLLRMKVTRPAPALVATFTELVRPMLNHNHATAEQSLTLSLLRDLLLPKLLSGELRIRDAEKMVEAHV